MKKSFYCLLILNLITIFLNANNYNFKNLTTSEGLSSNLIKAIYQDKKGFLWIGTYNGINRYDGKKTKKYYFDPENKTSIPDVVQRTDFFEDKNENIWFGTKNGLSRYNRNNDNFTNFINNPVDKESIGNNKITDISEDKNGQIWIATKIGISKFNKKLNTFYNYYLLKNESSQNEYPYFSIHLDNSGNIWVWNSNSIYKYLNNSFEELQSIKRYGKLSYKQITTLSNSKNNNLIIGTKKGLNVYSLENKTIDNYYAESSLLSDNHITTILKTQSEKIIIGTKKGLNIFRENLKDFIKIKNNSENDSIEKLFEDRNQRLWVATESGLKFLNKTNELENINTDKQTQTNLKHVNSMFEDRSGVLWIGTYGYGLYKFSIYNSKFDLIRKNDDSKNILSNRIRGIYKDNDLLWVGNNDGLYLINRKKKTSSLYNNNLNNPDKLNSFPVNIIFPYNQNELLIGTWAGLKKFKKKEKIFESLNINKVLSDIVVFDIILDKKKTLWLGTNKGVITVDNKIEKIINIYSANKTNKSLSNRYVYKLYEDSNENIWIGTGHGLNKLLKNKKEMIQYKNINNDSTSLSYNYISSIIEDNNKNIWIGTTGGGINRFNFKTSKFKRYTSKDGLSSNIITAIIEDKNNNLWISTYNGISMLNIKTMSFKNYYESDGLQKGDFNTNAAFISKDEEIFFGGMYGLNSFYPDNIKHNSYIPPIYITNLSIDGISVKKTEYLTNKNSSIDKGIFNFPYNTGNFSIEFAAFDYNIPESNLYKYRIENKDKNWIDLKNENKITFRNLNPEIYKIRIIGSNNDGIWNKEGTYITIIIHPPFWFTIWFKTIIIILFLIIIVLILKKYKRKIKAKYKKQNILNEMYIEKGISKREKEIIDLVIKGKNNKEIEDELFISIRTVSSHKYNIFKKLNINSTGDLKYLIKSIK